MFPSVEGRAREGDYVSLERWKYSPFVLQSIAAFWSGFAKGKGPEHDWPAELTRAEAEVDLLEARLAAAQSDVEFLKTKVKEKKQ